MSLEQRHLHLRGALGMSREEMHDGRKHLVVPTVALVGDIALHAVNAKHPEFVPLSLLSEVPSKWDGFPIMRGHPVDKQGRQISASDPAILASHGLGVIRNARIENKKLCVDAYIDIEKAASIGEEELLTKLRNGQMVECSIGAYVNTSAKAGEVNGRKYFGTWESLSPDHIAFLTHEGAKGACAISDMCGANRAAERYLVTAQGLELQMADDKKPKGEKPKGLNVKSLKARILALFDTPEQAAAEEAGELIAYNAMRVAFDAAGDQWDAASQIIDELIADEEENPSQTPAQEEAETEVEDARLDAVRMHCYSMIAALQSVCNCCSDQQMPVAVPSSDPRYMEQFKALIGKAISAANMKKVQAAHDSAHDLHAQAIALGAQCLEMSSSGPWEEEPKQEASTEPVRSLASKDGLRSGDRVQVTKDKLLIIGSDGKKRSIDIKLLASKDCPTCDGTGQVKADGKQADCEACDGTGVLKTAEEVAQPETGATQTEVAQAGATQAAASEAQLAAHEAAAQATIKAAACGCQEDTMTKDQRAEVMGVLINCKHSGFVPGDEKMLEMASDERLESFRVASDARANQERDLKAAAQRELTSEEFMKVAPPELRSLISRQQRQETEMKAELVTALKAAQSEYSEAELSVLPVADLERMARMARAATKADYSGRGIPRAAQEENTYAPPDPYQKGLDALRAASGRVN